MKRVKTSCGKSFVVSDIDYSLVTLFSWYIHHEGYVVTEVRVDGRRYFFSVHRLLMGVKPGVEVDHANMDKLDNRRRNLRWATKAENVVHSPRCGGRTPSTGTYRGVREVTYDGVRVGARKKYRAILGGRHIGYFKTPAEAAEAYNHAARQKYKRFAVINTIGLKGK